MLEQDGRGSAIDRTVKGQSDEVSRWTELWGGTPGREQMNLRQSEGITGQSADGPRQSVGRGTRSLTLITSDGGALENMGGNGLIS